MQSTERAPGITPCSCASPVVCTSAASPVRATRPRIPTPERNAFAQSLRGDSRFGFDFDVLGHIVENADADVVEAEILLDVADDVRQHLLGIFAGDRCLRNVVEEGKLARTPLLFGEQARILHRDGNLSSGGLHHFQVALFKGVLALGVHCRHHSGRPAPQQDGRTAEAFRRPRWQKSDAQPLPRLLQFGADQ